MEIAHVHIFNNGFEKDMLTGFYNFNFFIEQIPLLSYPSPWTNDRWIDCRVYLPNPVFSDHFEVYNSVVARTGKNWCQLRHKVWLHTALTTLPRHYSTEFKNGAVGVNFYLLNSPCHPRDCGFFYTTFYRPGLHRVYQVTKANRGEKNRRYK